MSITAIGTYFADHLAGSTATVQLLQHLKSINKQAVRDKFLIRLSADVEADQKSLEAMIQRLHVSSSPSKRAASWLAEKTARWKLWLDQSPESSLFWFEAFEAISLGIEGKNSLWRALLAAPVGSEIGRPELEELKRRATSQRGRVEKYRLAAGKDALRRTGK